MLLKLAKHPICFHKSRICRHLKVCFLGNGQHFTGRQETLTTTGSSGGEENPDVKVFQYPKRNYFYLVAVFGISIFVRKQNSVVFSLKQLILQVTTAEVQEKRNMVSLLIDG